MASQKSIDEAFPIPHAAQAAPLPPRTMAEAWLASLSDADAERVRLHAATVRDITISRESPLYGQRIVQLYLAATRSSEESPAAEAVADAPS